MVTTIATMRIGLAPHQEEQAGEGDGEQQNGEHHHGLQSAQAFSLANTMSLSHSHANQGAPGLEKEKMSRIGTQPLARIHSPVRMCQPVSQSLSSVFDSVHASEEKHDGHEKGEVRQRRQQLDRELGARLPFLSSMPSRNWPPAAWLRRREFGREMTGNPYNSRAGRSAENPRSEFAIRITVPWQ